MSVFQFYLSKFGLVTSLLVSIVFVVALSYLFEIRWATNDDIAMSMVSHGYGLAAFGSPDIFFSNVLWGYVVRAIPEINGILGYSIATLTTLIAVGVVMLYGLHQAGISYWHCLLIFVLLLLRPILFPQFTVNAGFLAVAVIICWHLYDKYNRLRWLVIGAVFAVFSYWIRNIEFMFVLLVALPLLPWRKFFNRSALYVLSFLVVIILVSRFIDHQAYQGDEWKNFNELNVARAPITDYRADILLKNRIDILKRYDYSVNDIELMGSWFFIDSDIANPKVLKKMLSELGSISSQDSSIDTALTGFLVLKRMPLLPLFVVSLLLFVLRPSWKLLMCWGLFLGSIFVIGLLGRPGISRIYYPVLSLLVVAPFLLPQISRRHGWVVTGVLMAGVLYSTPQVLSESLSSQKLAEQVRKDLSSFPNSPVVIWGSSFPLEHVYPVLGISSAAKSYQFYPLGVFSIAPFSPIYIEQKAGQDMMTLFTKKGIPFVAYDDAYRMLNIYCKEHHSGNVKELSSQQYGKVLLSTIQCVSSP